MDITQSRESLRQEIAGEQLPIPLDGPRGEAILDELHCALHPIIHERAIASYGAIIYPQGVLPGQRIVLGTVSDARELADGMTSFYVRSEGESPALVCSDEVLVSETALVALSLSADAVLIHRSMDGAVRVFTGKHVVSCIGRSWTAKIYATAGIPAILREAPQAYKDRRVLETLLNFTFHSLSPNHIGTTIVWYLSDGHPEPSPNIEIRKNVPANTLTFANASHLGAIKHLLSQHDGAALVDRSGGLFAVDARLHPSEKALSLVQSHKGTRHTSAKRYSFDEASAVVIVVSEDGPVTVFSDGENILELRLNDVDLHEIAAVLQVDVPEKSEEISSETEVIKCGNCNRCYLTTFLYIGGWNDPERENCPYCRELLIRRKCFRIEVNSLVKCF